MNKIGKKSLIVIIFIAIILVAALVAHFTAPAKQPITAQKFVIPERSADPYFGTSTAKVTIVEFSDFACPYCQEEYGIVRSIGIKYKNSIKIIYKDFPLHDISLDLAMAGRCAGQQGFFWPMHDKLFSLQGQFATSSLIDMAVSIGANRTIFAECLNDKNYSSSIRADYNDGQSLGVTGTPTFFINGYRIVGTIPENQFEEIIKQFLK
jgi:protein-disulfide isomerase